MKSQKKLSLIIVGLLAIRKKANSYISGKYLIIVDADDTISDKLIVKLYEYINIYKPDIIKFDINEINSIKDKNRYILNIDKMYCDGKEALYEWNTYDVRYGMFSMYCFKKDLYEKSMMDSFYS